MRDVRASFCLRLRVCDWLVMNTILLLLSQATRFEAETRLKRKLLLEIISMQLGISGYMWYITEAVQTALHLLMFVALAA